MAILQVRSPQAPQAPEKKESGPSDMDKIMQALQIANAGFGIATSIQKLGGWDPASKAAVAQEKQRELAIEKEKFLKKGREDIAAGAMSGEARFVGEAQGDVFQKKPFQEGIAAQELTQHKLGEAAEMGPEGPSVFRAPKSALDMFQQAEKLRSDKEVKEQSRIDKLDKEQRATRLKDEKTYERAVMAAALGIGRGSRAIAGDAMRRRRLAANGLRIIESVDKGEFTANPQIAQELAGEMASLLSGGNAAHRTTIDELVPDTFVGRKAEFLQFLKSKPQEALTPEIIDHFRHQLKGQQQFWKEQVMNLAKRAGHVLEPVFKRKDRDGKFVNADLLENFELQLEMLDKQDSPAGKDLGPGGVLQVAEEESRPKTNAPLRNAPPKMDAFNALPKELQEQIKREHEAQFGG